VIRLEQSLHGFSDVKNVVVAFFATTSPKSLSS
jgi:hypothetical protein